ncbi:hypothetical protein [Paenibacillus sp. BAC0078]
MGIFKAHKAACPQKNGQAAMAAISVIVLVIPVVRSLFSYRWQIFRQLGWIANANLIALFANDMIPGGQNPHIIVSRVHLMETAATDAVKFPHGFISGIVFKNYRKNC